MSGLFSSEGDNPPPFMQQPEDNPESGKQPEPEPAPAQKPAEAVPEPKSEPPKAEEVVEKSTEEAAAAVERSAAATTAPPKLSAQDIATGADFATVMQAAQLLAKDEKVRLILGKASEGFAALAEKLGSEENAKKAVGALYMESVEGKLVAASAAQRNAESE